MDRKESFTEIATLMKGEQTSLFLQSSFSPMSVIDFLPGDQYAHLV